ncbi:sensor domain-containing diguanylate cyclase [Colwellia sp. C1TZA3]|uniref:sensor domain-containing diguanylate cyclase n=1 Tax=Colwellia sp. C1TZA3 TaxID=2508879 RepID=UPI0011B9EF1E|nr:sensor domain-containing diguanylate cyclase [Colwellia sp. C1TZA3]TWX66930.1 sensor domain-containing diguanylate cyclase [Colwellia sp. C1TZA3]
MLAPTLPKNEECRLASLNALKILDTDPEERFDRFTRLAKKIFNVPIALVTLVDKDRQWFKSSVGLDAKETPREISFCGHAIHQNNTFIIEDALKDVRFFDNPLVVNLPDIRFYAGHPIASPSGENIGTLCIIDTKKRTLSDDELASLTDLSALITDEFISWQLATMDKLTNITNRLGFKRLSQHSIDKAVRQNNDCHLAYFDLNDFTLLNDHYGHMIGDQVLKLFAEQLKISFRVSDVCARIGSDEFVVLLSDTELETAKQVIKRFAYNLISVSKHLALPYQISFAHGIVSFDQEKHINIEHLLNDADQVMDDNKGKKQVLYQFD